MIVGWRKFMELHFIGNICNVARAAARLNMNVSLLATETVTSCGPGVVDEVLVALGIPSTPSPFKSWWKLVSSAFNAVLVPE